MLRVATPDGWRLITHQNHARLAGAFGKLWGNETFPVPEPIEDILLAVNCHDDAWQTRDAAPLIAPDGTPSAFSRELVGTYSAFENIDLEAYLAVRGAATESVARANPASAVLVSMHTVNLLTEQADLSTLSEKQRHLHGAFISAQLERQSALKASLPRDKQWAESAWERAFKFLQACDSFSLIACVQYDKPIALRHTHPSLSSGPLQISCHPCDGLAFQLTPYPLSQDGVEFKIPSRTIRGTVFASDEALQKAYAEGQDEMLRITVQR